MSTSQIFTIGTALRRAEDNGVPVEVLVEGQWLRGDIAGLDGDGLVLVTPERTQCVVRNAHISVVRILANLSFDDEAPSEPQATSYESGSTTYDAPRAWEPTGADAPASEAAASTGGPAPEDASPFRWASAHAGAGAEPGPVVSEPDEDPLVRGAADEDGLALGAAHGDDVLVLDAGNEGPLELGSSREADETPDTDDTTEAGTEAVPEASEEPSGWSDEPAPAEVIELRPEPVAEEVAEQQESPKESSDDLVSRLLAESMREAGIEPEQPASVEVSPDIEPESDLETDPAADDDHPAPSELLHPEKAPADDDEPRIFALPAPSAVAPAAAAAAPASVPATAASVPATAASAQPAPATETAPAPAPAAAPAAEAPAAAPAAEAAAPAAGDDWRSMLEGLRSEAAAPQSGAQNGQPEEKRRGRRLVMR